MLQLPIEEYFRYHPPETSVLRLFTGDRIATSSALKQIGR